MPEGLPFNEPELNPIQQLLDQIMQLQRLSSFGGGAGSSVAQMLQGIGSNPLLGLFGVGGSPGFNMSGLSQGSPQGPSLEAPSWMSGLLQGMQGGRSRYREELGDVNDYNSPLGRLSTYARYFSSPEGLKDTNRSFNMFAGIPGWDPSIGRAGAAGLAG